MNEEYFKKGIEKLKNIRMTDVEKARVLKNVLSASSESPYMQHAPTFAFVSTRYTHMIYAFCLVLIFSLVGATYVSGKSLPGDLLYPIKTRIVEPVLDVINSAPEKRIIWEEEKVSRRIAEAEKLEEKNELSDERVTELERHVEKSSRAFVQAVKESELGSVKVEDRKNEFRKKFEVREGVEENTNNKTAATNTVDQNTNDFRLQRSSRNDSIVNNLKRFAIETIDSKDDDDRNDNRGKGGDGKSGNNGDQDSSNLRNEIERKID